MDIKLLKKLREETQAGMLECKEALTKFEDNYEEALTYVLANTTKKDSNQRVASKGMCQVVIKDNEAILFEVNAETDFVTKNENFVNMVGQIGIHLIDTDVTNAKTALKEIIDGQTIETIIERTSGLIKEQASLRRFYRVRKDDSQAFGAYTHMQGKLVTLVILNKNEKEIANQIAMQVAAMNAEYLDLKLIDEDTMNYEKFMYEKQNGHFDQADFERMMSEKTLSSQPWMKDASISVNDFIDRHDIKIIDFFKFELGQGIDNKLNCRLDIPCDGSKITVTPVY